MQTKVLFRAAMVLVLGSISAFGCQGDEQEVASPAPEPGMDATGGAASTPTESATGGDAPAFSFETPEDALPEGSVCGDGLLYAGEECDDGNTTSGDGCTLDCKRELLFICLTPGQPCIHEVCGDSVRTASELCDDGNVIAGDGCDATCQLELGWQCLGPGRACVPKCGDGLVSGNELCDDGNRVDGDGCGAGCLVELGWFNCPPVGTACQAAVCGNAVVEANEGCDDGNDISGDGCNAACQREPAFDSAGVALPACGDGAKTLGEACDDGNLIAGDGCSDTCTVEGAFECGEPTQEPEAVRLAVMFRDFTDEHPDFEYKTPGLELGIVGSACTVATAATCGVLDAEGKPVLNETETFESTHTAADFQQWYRDVEGVNLPFPSALELTRMTENGQTIYRFEDRDFYPLDGEGFGEYENSGHNYHFTTELRYFIQYAGGERLEFSGDDDVWIFVNRRLAVDIGGVHAVEEGFILLGDEDGDGILSAEEEADPTDDRFGITKGNLYEVHLFHAERHTIWSNFKLTLQNFILSSSVCTPICGNGSIEPGESCDDGSELNTGEYGACSPDCSGREYCGDETVQSESGEECDDGVNLSPYGALEGCALGCTRPLRCGDGILSPEYGETCDLGDGQNGVPNSGCSLECQKVAVVT